MAEFDSSEATSRKSEIIRIYNKKLMDLREKITGPYLEKGIRTEEEMRTFEKEAFYYISEAYWALGRVRDEYLSRYKK